jgi:hypothetical protein
MVGSRRLNFAEDLVMHNDHNDNPNVPFGGSVNPIALSQMSKTRHLGLPERKTQHWNPENQSNGGPFPSP